MRCIPEVFVTKSKENTEDKNKRNKENKPREEARTESKAAKTSVPSVRYLIKMNPSSTKHSAIDLSTLFILSEDLGKVHEIKKSVNPESIYTVYLATGSTGFPKSVPFTHFRSYNVIAQFRVISKRGDKSFNDRSLAWIGSSCLAPLICGRTKVYVHPLANAKESEVDFCLQVCCVILDTY